MPLHASRLPLHSNPNSLHPLISIPTTLSFRPLSIERKVIIIVFRNNPAPVHIEYTKVPCLFSFAVCLVLFNPSSRLLKQSRLCVSVYQLPKFNLVQQSSMQSRLKLDIKASEVMLKAIRSVIQQ